MSEIILHMEPERGARLYEKARNEKRDEMLYLRWIHGYQSSMTFKAFKEEVLGGLSDGDDNNELSEQEIYEKVRDILRKD